MGEYIMDTVLKMCYENYLKTGDSKFKLIARCGDDVVPHDNIVHFLEEDELINIIDETFGSFTIAITEKGINKAKTLL